MWLPHSEFSGVKDQGGLPVTAEYNILVTIGEKMEKMEKRCTMQTLSRRLECLYLHLLKYISEQEIVPRIERIMMVIGWVQRCNYLI